MKCMKKYLAAALAITMLLANGISAAAQPSQVGSPTWADAWNVMDYVWNNVYSLAESGELEFVDVPAEDMDSKIAYFESGKKIAPVCLEVAYDDLMQGYWIPNEEGKEGTDSTDVNEYNSLYATGMAFVSSVRTATGEKYTYDLDAMWESQWKSAEHINNLVDTHKIAIIEPDMKIPDTAEMDKGTWWVESQYAQSYWNELTSVSAASDNWVWGNESTERDILRSEYESVIHQLTSAIETFRSKLKEGIKEAENAETITPPSIPDSSSSSGTATAEEAPVIVNQVVTADGQKLTSNIEGIYIAGGSVNGVVFTSPKIDIQTAAGITEEESKKGVVSKFYVCDTRNKDIKKAISELTEAEGYQLSNVINIDLYKLDSGVISSVRTAVNPVDLKLGIPSELIKEGRSFVLIGYDVNGNKVILADNDADNKTITVSTTVFGAFGIAWK